MSNQHDTESGCGNADQSREVAAILQNAETKRPRVTLLAICLLIVAMFMVLVLMIGINISRIKSEAEARSAARMEKIKPVNETTMKIESSTWKIQMWGIRNRHRLPKNLSDALDDDVDAWGKPMRIEHEGSPVTGYTISSAGKDGQFSTQDDIAIRFSIDHEEIERINTYGLKEMGSEMDALMGKLGMDANGN